jgi:protein-disulfide isomerase
LEKENEYKNQQTLAKSNSENIFKGSFVLGNPQGSAKLVAFVDPLCPYCSKLIKGMLEKVKTDSSVGFYIVPFGVINRSSNQLSKMMLTIARSYPSKLLEFSNKVSAEASEISKEKVTAILQDLEIDVAKINKSLTSADIQKTVENNAKVAKEIGISGVPTVFAIDASGDWILVPPVDVKTFDQMLKDLKNGKKIGFASKS